MSWTDEYREIIEFYYWEPHHIGRSGGVKRFSGADEMWESVNTLEVSLNHMLNIFFSLFDINKLSLGHPEESTLLYTSSKQLEAWQREMKGYTQPDIYFQGLKSNLAIELKTTSKLSLDQVTKYLVFNSYVSPTHKPLRLIVLSPHSELSSVSKEKHHTADELITNLKKVICNKKSLNICPQERFMQEVSGLTLSTLSFSQLYTLLANLHIDNNVEKRLVDGMNEYLQSRSVSRSCDLNVNLRTF